MKSNFDVCYLTIRCWDFSLDFTEGYILNCFLIKNVYDKSKQRDIKNKTNI